MTPEHVSMLDTIGVGRFDPSVSPRLSVASIRNRFRGRLLWRINAMQFRDLTTAQIADAVTAAADQGADRVWCHIEPIMCDQAGAEKVRAFLDAAKASAVVSSA